jgi:hypothetical protein
MNLLTIEEGIFARRSRIMRSCIFMLDEVGAGCSRGATSVVSMGAPHCPQKRLPNGTSALHFWHLSFKDEAQFKQIWMPSGFWKPQ